MLEMKSCKLSRDENQLKKYSRSMSRLSTDLLVLNLAKPALRALIDHKISNSRQLNRFTDSQIIKWHGIGPQALKKLKPFLKYTLASK